jgi:hypothetical protein
MGTLLPRDWLCCRERAEALGLATFLHYGKVCVGHTVAFRKRIWTHQQLLSGAMFHTVFYQAHQIFSQEAA